MAELVVDGRKVETWCAIRGMTQEQAAIAAGIAVPTLTNLKNSAKWRSTTLCALARVLDIHPYDLLSDHGFPPPHVGAPAMALNGS